MLPYCEEAYITEIDAELEADTFIPVFSKQPGWELFSSSDVKEENGLSYRFTVYRRTDHGE